MRARLQEALDRAGSKRTIADIAEACQTGEMQWWQNGNGVCITRIELHEGQKILAVIAVFGVWEDAIPLQPTIVAFGKEHGCTAFVTYGRKGWFRVLPKLGWIPRGDYLFLDLTK